MTPLSAKRFVVLSCALLAIGFRPTAATAQPDGDPGTESADVQVTYRLGFQGEIQPSGGMLVLRVRPGTPATRLTLVDDQRIRGMLESGDLLTHVDGRPIQTSEDYRAAMHASGENNGQIVLTIVHVQSGRSTRWETTADAVRVVGEPTESHSRRVHFLFVGLTDDIRLGDAIEHNLTSLQTTAREEISEDRLGTIRIVRGGECNAPAILNAVREFPVGYGDAVFCHYSGHGAYDPTLATEDDPSEGHFFDIPSGDLPRRDLWNALEQHGARLTVLVSDTCNVQYYADVGTTREYQAITAAPGYTPLELLLLGHRGKISISAADKDQYSWYSSNFGGWFTVEMCRILRSYNDWSLAFAALQDSTNRVFQQRKLELLASDTFAGAARTAMEDQDSLQPRVFRLDVIRDDQSLRARPAQPVTRTRSGTHYSVP